MSPHFAISETPRYVGRAVGERSPRTPTVAAGTADPLSAGQLAKEYGFTDLDGRPDAWRYLVEVQDPGNPTRATGYR